MASVISNSILIFIYLLQGFAESWENRREFLCFLNPSVRKTDNCPLQAHLWVAGVTRVRGYRRTYGKAFFGFSPNVAQLDGETKKVQFEKVRNSLSRLGDCMV